MKYYMVMDVESIGLMGEGFAVGYVVVDQDGKELERREYSCDPRNAQGGPKDRKWVAENCPTMTRNCDTTLSLRGRFYHDWAGWRTRGALLFADVPFPVETNFFRQCVKDNPYLRQPAYPLLDVASVRFAAGLDPLATEERLPNELPKHNPLCDARQSARLLIEAITKIKGAI